MSPRPARGHCGSGVFDSPLGPTKYLASLALQNVNPEFRFSTPLSPKIPRQRPCRGKLKPGRPLWGAHGGSSCPFRRLLRFLIAEDRPTTSC